MADNGRIDKVLWALRIFKTRTDAAQACKGGKVKVAGANAKPSREVHPGDRIEVRKGAVQLSYRLLQVPSGRLGASLVENYVQDLTPPEEKEKMNAPVQTLFVVRERGAGRPTKKDRRMMESAWEILGMDSGEDE